jgi:hypothetical protein
VRLLACGGWVKVVVVVVAVVVACGLRCGGCNLVVGCSAEGHRTWRRPSASLRRRAAAAMVTAFSIVFQQSECRLGGPGYWLGAFFSFAVQTKRR